MTVKWVLILYFIKAVAAQDGNCDFTQNVDVNKVYYVYSPGYPNRYPGGVTCRWIAACPTGYNCVLNCSEVSLPNTPGCTMDRLLISRSGDPQLTDSETYCGSGSVNAVSTGQRLSVGLISRIDSPGGKFLCTLRALPASNVTNCRCGERRQNRIVGGEETGVNEYPMMAGLARASEKTIRCGAVIISQNYVLTAAHCLRGEDVNDTAVIVGLHDVTGSESQPAIQAYKANRFLIHPWFDQNNYDYDIAIIAVAGPIQFSDRVGPVCLPFKFVNDDFYKKKVTILGWGTTDPGAPTSKVLLKANVDVISQVQCMYNYSSLTPRQICTYTSGKDSCQNDSGGPLLYMDPLTGLLFNVGIVSYGRPCASGYPAVNARITALLDWITNVTQKDYCIK